MQHWNGDGTEISKEEFDSRLGRVTDAPIQLTEEQIRMFECGEVILSEGRAVADEIDGILFPPKKESGLLLTFGIVALVAVAFWSLTCVACYMIWRGMLL